ncbi:MAG: hypothetical protein IJ424_01070 [Oscillospiraceae bacterium]|nr:hypothetical protein [Oscillospiraceae bacterium]
MIPPTTAVEPTEKEKEPTPTESEDQATEPTVTATAPTTTNPKEETKATETAKPTTSSAAESTTENTTEYQPTWEDINVYGYMVDPSEDQLPEEPTEKIVVPPKPSADTVAQKVAEYINQFRTEQGDVTATVIPGLTEYCKYRCTQLKTNFAHDTTDQRAAAKALQYGECVDWSLYGIEGEGNYYTANVREAIGKGNWGGTADEIAYSIANGFRNSKLHWSCVGSSKYTYMAVGVMYDGYYWYVCVCMDSENTDLK